MLLGTSRPGWTTRDAHRIEPGIRTWQGSSVIFCRDMHRPVAAVGPQEAGTIPTSPTGKRLCAMPHSDGSTRTVQFTCLGAGHSFWPWVSHSEWARQPDALQQRRSGHITRAAAFLGVLLYPHSISATFIWK
jgi:hypothetical protein